MSTFSWDPEIAVQTPAFTQTLVTLFLQYFADETLPQASVEGTTMEACDGECAQFVICDQDLSKTHIRESCIAHTRLLGVTFVRTNR